MQVFYFSTTLAAGLYVMDWAQQKALHNVSGRKGDVSDNTNEDEGEGAMGGSNPNPNPTRNPN